MKASTLIALAVLVVLCQAQQCYNQGFSNDPICTSWLINYYNESTYFQSIVNVQNVTEVSLSGEKFMQITATGIPQYDHVMTTSDIDWLDSRPKASSDFTNGKTNATVGEIVPFGESIGYASGGNKPGCSLGYWPPGPQCPSATTKKANFPIEPVESSSDCYTTLGAVGYWVNGVSVYNWWDGTSYNNQDTWHTMAAWGEYYDLDICSGHAANGDYHHHTFPNCLRDVLDDNGSGKSPIYGFAADGFPILGPWVSEGVLAKSCWKNRDYDDPSSSTGCGTAHKRTCLLVDQYDISKGTVSTSNHGPDTNANVLTQSGNSIQASSGFYFEDHYYDSSCTSQGDSYLDQFNGRYDETYGYVYHTTITNLDNPEFVTSTFPHFIGPTFYGELNSNTMVQCTSTAFSKPSGGGGGGPPAGPPHAHH